MLRMPQALSDITNDIFLSGKSTDFGDTLVVSNVDPTIPFHPKAGLSVHQPGAKSIFPLQS